MLLYSAYHTPVMASSMRASLSRSAREAARHCRERSTSAAEQIDELAGTEVRFPLFMYLRGLRTEQDAKLDSISRDIKGLTRDINGLKETVARLPLVVLGVAIGATGLVEYCGYKLRVLPHEGCT
jgi:hypothetical protein